MTAGPLLCIARATEPSCKALAHTDSPPMTVSESWRARQVESRDALVHVVMVVLATVTLLTMRVP